MLSTLLITASSKLPLDLDLKRSCFPGGGEEAVKEPVDTLNVSTSGTMAVALVDASSKILPPDTMVGSIALVEADLPILISSSCPLQTLCGAALNRLLGR